MRVLLGTSIFLFSLSASAQESEAPAGERLSLSVDEELETEASEQPAETAEEAVAAPAAGPTIQVTVTLKNGVSLNGQVIQNDLLMWSEGTDLAFTPEGGTATVLPGANIASITQAGSTPTAPVVVVTTAPEVEAVPESNYRSPEGFRFPNPAASRYLYAPSAINLKKGQGYVSQKFVFTAMAYAPSDNFTLLMGTFTPFPPLMSVFGGKASIELKEGITAAVGGEAFVLGVSQEVPLSIGFGSLTFGNEDKHLTVATGYGSGDFFTDGPVIPLMIAGQWRSSLNIALITEQWLLFDAQTAASGDIGAALQAHIGSVAFRLVGRRDRGDGVERGLRTKEGHPRTTWDLGFVALSWRNLPALQNLITGESEQSELSAWEGFAPLPWVDWTWHFGGSGVN